MTLKEIQERNYQACLKRGVIGVYTQPYEFEDKLREELKEIEQSFLYDEEEVLSIDEMEIADMIIVCLNIANHYDIDIQKALEEKTIINENR